MKSDYIRALSSIKKDIENFSELSNEKISLVVVTKSQTIEDISSIIKCGHKRLGENYVDEAIKKIEFFKDNSIEWHFIGKIQSNKINLKLATGGTARAAIELVRRFKINDIYSSYVS